MPRAPQLGLRCLTLLVCAGLLYGGRVSAQRDSMPYEISPDMALPALGPDRLRVVPPTPQVRVTSDDASDLRSRRSTAARSQEPPPAAPAAPLSAQTFVRAPGPGPDYDGPIEFGRLIVVTRSDNVDVTIDGQPYPVGSMQGVLLYAYEQYEVLMESAEGAEESAASEDWSRVITIRVRPGETRILMANLGASEETASRRSNRERTRERRERRRQQREQDEEDEIGYLGVSSSPRGTVYVDGDNTGEMTPARRIELEPGRHEVRIFYESEERFSETKNVLIRAGVNTNVFFRLRRDEEDDEE